MSERRSARANKGKHSKRDLDLYLYDEKTIDPQDLKRVKVDDDADYLQQNQDEEVVRCLPCGTTQENYNEETDTGGTFIQCDDCNTWQHAKCMGYNSNKSIPDNYQCNVCNPDLYKKSSSSQATASAKGKGGGIATSSSGADQNKQEVLHGLASITASLKSDHRLSTAKAFFSYFKKSFQNDKTDQQNEDLAAKWALEIEEIIFKTYPDKKYTEGGRRILFILKKHFMKELLEGTLTFEDLVKKTPKEINRDIEKVEEKVRGNIKNIILTANEPSDIVRRTHKGDIIRENENDHLDDIDLNITTKTVDHRIFEKEKEISEEEQRAIENRKNSYLNMNPRIEDDDDDDDEVQDVVSAETENSEKVDAKSSESLDLEHVHENVSEDDLYPILTGNAKAKAPDSRNNLKVWTGRITFPDFASFEGYGEFYSSPDYDEFASRDELKLHTSICSDILTQDSYFVEGRLDRQKADAYLNKITSSRNLYLVELKPSKHDDEQFQKLYKYLLIKNKVGVLSDKPWFVKDAYLIPVDFRDEHLPYYLLSQRADLRIGLFALYSVKKEYRPAGSNTPAPTEYPMDFLKNLSLAGGNELSQIMSQLQ
ncbi:uncharacterized protein CANTADRAFT_26671 [Suhomyces tanzawaensis NRRL Y-17324]|uniref:Transcription factor BYE1 n=1 Tax=Suhomyces tanzawaensis NRRL Y-17324 TaxID=984487 RepID=A0A1E4SGX2_9ASCO|nr:uncharacterized protein CANTADRAFT_26671 [Suhomyces tanzawaensis NRRL Y-17324]ODV78662.1 hypothetical protein CANTADRAFT_26671 [Suhomyces tanzawaensis NRRL Y-17324]